MENVVFYHAGCPVCVSAEQDFLNLIDTTKIKVDIIHLGEEKDAIDQAEKAGIKSVPALLFDNGNVIHLNFGASVEDVKNS